MRRVRSTYLVAGAITLAALAWMLTGMFADEGDAAKDKTILETLADAEVDKSDDPSVQVRVHRSQASMQRKFLELRATTKSKRSVVVRAETGGRLLRRPVELGARVSEGDILCEIEAGDREARLAQANAAVAMAELDHQASLKLLDQGFQTRLAKARAYSALKTAEADRVMRSLDLDLTRIDAPYSGMVEMIHAHRGDLLAIGQPCTTLVDLDPMLVVGFVSERDVGSVVIGSDSMAEFIDGSEASGKVTFVSRDADAETRTYRVEATLANEDFSIRSGLAAILRVALEALPAHWVRTSQFSLNDQGLVGIRILDDDDRVQFVPVAVVRETAKGVWVTGLPTTTRIITVGHNYVFPGQQVDPVIDRNFPIPSPSAPGTDPIQFEPNPDGNESPPDPAASSLRLSR